MRVHEVVDVADPRIEAFTSLTEVQLRLAFEPQAGIFIAEGHTVISRAFHAGLEPVVALMERKWLSDLSDELDRYDIDVFIADQDVLKAVTGFRLHRGALVAFRRFALPTAASVAANARTVVVLEDLVDHTNVGLIFRSAAGLGADAVLVSPRCADPLYRRSVKVSMGAVFSIPWAWAEPWPWILDDLTAAGFETVALTPDPTASNLATYQRAEKVALLLGSEGPGLSPMAQQRADRRLAIPMAHGIDSLNVAATAAVACYAITTSEKRA